MKMDDNILVSVIIPTYARPDNIIRAIDSVLAQTYKYIEIIVVDDNGEGTPYQLETEKVLADYITQRKISYLKHEVNKNGSAARNTGFRASRGEYVNFLDDDDYFKSENIDKKVRALLNTSENVGGSFSPVCHVGHAKNGDIREYPHIYKKEGNVLEDFLIGKALFNTSGILFKRSAIAALDGFDESYRRHQDFELLIRFFNNYTLKLASDQPLYYMSADSSGAHGKVIKDRLTFECDFLHNFKKELSEQGCYHSVSHFFYWQCACDYLGQKSYKMFWKSLKFSHRHEHFSLQELRILMIIYVKKALLRKN